MCLSKPVPQLGRRDSVSVIIYSRRCFINKINKIPYGIFKATRNRKGQKDESSDCSHYAVGLFNFTIECRSVLHKREKERGRSEREFLQ